MYNLTGISYEFLVMTHAEEQCLDPGLKLQACKLPPSYCA